MSNNPPVIYLIPGQGADERLFNKLDLGAAFDIRHIEYFTPQDVERQRPFIFKKDYRNDIELGTRSCASVYSPYSRKQRQDYSDQECTL